MLDLWRIKNFMNQNEIVVEWSSKTLSYKKFSDIFTTKKQESKRSVSDLQSAEFGFISLRFQMKQKTQKLHQIQANRRKWCICSFAH